MVSTKIFTGDGSTKIFPIEFEIKGEDYIQIWLDNVAVNDRTTYDIINNSIVFLNDYIPDNGVKVEIVVATTAQEIADLNAPSSTVQVVVDNIDNLIDISDQVISNMNEILQADDNATIATTKASEASNSAIASNDSANDSASSASEALAYRNTALTYRNEAETFKNTAGNSADTATEQADIATTKASEASTSATNAQLEAWIAEAKQLTADSYATEAEDTFVNLVTSNGDGTFTYTPTTEYSALHHSLKARTFNPAIYAPISSPALIGTPTANGSELLTHADVTTSSTDTTAGRIMKVGDFGLGAMTPTRLIGIDLDTVELPVGFYSGDAWLNTPYSDLGNGWSYLIVENLASESTRYKKYTYMKYNTGVTWTRVKAAGTWQSWKQLATTDSPALIGTPTAPTPAAGDNSTRIATTEYVDNNASTPTTTDILNATAGASVGAVGTYALLVAAAWSSGLRQCDLATGSTLAGSKLRYAYAAGQSGTSGSYSHSGAFYNTGGAPSGTWRLMGYLVDLYTGTTVSHEDSGASLWLRIA